MDNEERFPQPIGFAWAWRIGVRHSLMERILPQTYHCLPSPTSYLPARDEEAVGAGMDFEWSLDVGSLLD